MFLSAKKLDGVLAEAIHMSGMALRRQCESLGLALGSPVLARVDQLLVLAFHEKADIVEYLRSLCSTYVNRYHGW
jgi:hypothetical protein